MAWIYHKLLDRTIEVPDSSVPHHAQAGWVQVDPPPKAPVVIDEETKPARRRKSTVKESTDGDA
jgi:hypothetical protein